tara:strand:+ start:200 stop:367 length:168 start_codon:yes stop_codon:yes gene_type:complete
MDVNNSDGANQKTVKAFVDTEEHTVYRFKGIGQKKWRKIAMTWAFWGSTTREQQR